MPRGLLMARVLIFVGLTCLLAGIFWQFGEKFGLGKLPGDLSIKGEGYEIKFPLVTCLLLSLALSGVLWIWRTFRGP